MVALDTIKETTNEGTYGANDHKWFALNIDLTYSSDEDEQREAHGG